MSRKKVELIDKNVLLENIAYLMPQNDDGPVKLKKLYKFIVNEIKNQPTVVCKEESDALDKETKAGTI